MRSDESTRKDSTRTLLPERGERDEALTRRSKKAFVVCALWHMVWCPRRVLRGGGVLASVVGVKSKGAGGG